MNHFPNPNFKKKTSILAQRPHQYEAGAFNNGHSFDHYEYSGGYNPNLMNRLLGSESSKEKRSKFISTMAGILGCFAVTATLALHEDNQAIEKLVSEQDNTIEIEIEEGFYIETGNHLLNVEAIKQTPVLENSSVVDLSDHYKLIENLKIEQPIELSLSDIQKEEIRQINLTMIASEFEADVARWLPEVAKKFPESEWRTALCVIDGESDGQPEAYNTAPSEAKEGSAGLTQIAVDNVSGNNRVAGLEDEPYRTHKEARQLLFKPIDNIRIAFKMWLAKGWLPAWAAQKHKCGLLH